MKNFKTGQCMCEAENMPKQSQDIVVHGIILSGKCHTDPPMLPPQCQDDESHHDTTDTQDLRHDDSENDEIDIPNITTTNHDDKFQHNTNEATIMTLHLNKEQQIGQLRSR